MLRNENNDATSILLTVLLTDSFMRLKQVLQPKDGFLQAPLVEKKDGGPYGGPEADEMKDQLLLPNVAYSALNGRE